MNVGTTYLYESLDNDIYMQIPEGFKVSENIDQDLVIYTQLSWNDPCMD